MGIRSKAKRKIKERREKVTSIIRERFIDKELSLPNFEKIEAVRKLNISKSSAIRNHKDSGEKSRETTDESSRTVFVGNLPSSIDKKQFKALFKTYGPIESVRLRCSALKISFIPRTIATAKKDFHEGASSLYGYVKFVNKESAEKALEANGTIYEDSCICVDRSDSSKEEKKKHSVFLGNLPFTITDDDIREKFSQCGDIESVHVVRDKATGVGKGFGYVTFKTPHSVELSLRFNGTLIGKREIRVRKVSKKKALKRKREFEDNEENLTDPSVTASNPTNGSSGDSSGKTNSANNKESNEVRKKKKREFQGVSVNKKISKATAIRKKKLNQERKNKKKLLKKLFTETK